MAAPNNRTVTITEAERDTLQQMVDRRESVICGDMLSELGRVPDASINLIILDPPYNLSRDFGGNAFRQMKENDYEEYLMSWLPQVVNKLTPDGSLYMCGDWHCCSAMQRSLENVGLTIMNRITWQREKGRGASANWKNSMEDIWFAVKDAHNYYFDVEAVKQRRRVLAPYREGGRYGTPKDWEQTDGGKFRMTCPSNFWDDISVPFWSMPENTEHPTQKPEKLIAKLILASSREGDVILDPFLGSGTTAVVAKKLGRRCIGIEQNNEYCLLATKRLLMADDDDTIQGYRDGVFWERNSGR